MNDEAENEIGVAVDGAPAVPRIAGVREKADYD
jgi:hypothetical protein